MQQQSMNPALPLSRLIIIVGTTCGCLHGSHSSVGLYLPAVTEVLDVS
jgi:hypothetical protein